MNDLGYAYNSIPHLITRYEQRMIFGIGVDIVAISRFERFIAEANQPLLHRVFTDREREYAAGKKLSAQHYALRFAAKEAFLKALGTGLRNGISWQDMEIENDQLGKPSLRLSRKALELYEKNELKVAHVSLSHDADAAVAMVVLER